MIKTTVQPAHPILRILAYASAKLTAAGTIFLTLMVITTGLNPVDLQQTIHAMPFWTFLYIYGVLYSISVDAVTFRLRPQLQAFVRVLLYIAGGYVPFFVLFWNHLEYVVFIGLYGVVCALCFYGLDTSMKRKWPLSGIAACVLLVVLSWLTLADHTRVEGWTEQLTESGFTATFDYFHGERAIPLSLEAGETLTLQVNFRMDGDGGHGFRVADRSGDPIGMELLADDTMRLVTERDMEIHIMISGNRASGEVEVRWHMEKEE
ncbi:hypothetical protein [Paenibacillus daejeonensis]|uniref:hypothetical protein n=1 Tax=Paenibacillus daejeonensis TaxID=135193 RepID=UPI0003749A7C|nr:hypothetical protein [Paenibacillus daejeonensis]